MGCLAGRRSGLPSPPAGPHALQVEAIELVKENETRPLRWSRAADGLITIFLAESPPRGCSAAAGSHADALPRQLIPPVLELEDCRTVSQQTVVFRHPDVQVRANRPLEGGGAAIDPTLGRLAGSYRTEGTSRSAEGAPFTLELSPNDPAVQATQIVTLRRSGKRWSLDVDFQFRVRDGALDVFVWNVPPQIADVTDVSPRSTVEIAAVAGDNLRQIVITPDKVLEDSARVRFSVSLIFRRASG